MIYRASEFLKVTEFVTVRVTWIVCGVPKDLRANRWRQLIATLTVATRQKIVVSVMLA